MTTPASHRRPPLVVWVEPTTGYLVCAAVTATLLSGAGVAWLLLDDRGGRSVPAIVLALAAGVVMVGLARRARPWSPGATRRGRAPCTREERRAVRRAVWRGVLPDDPALAREAVRWIGGRAAFAPFTAVFLYAAALHLVSGRGVVAWVWIALPTVLVSEALWCAHQARRLQASWEVMDAGRTARTT